VIDGYDEAPSCSSFTSGSFDIDVIFHVHCTKPVWCVTPQDVPRTIKLLSAIIAIAKFNPALLPFTSLGCIPDVNVVADFEALQVLGFTLENLLEPFTNVKLSLSEQVIHLSCFAHLLYTFYRDQHHHFMPNQLYYDSQMMVKNAIFSIAKQQKLDPSSRFSLLDVGDDALELMFALL